MTRIGSDPRPWVDRREAEGDRLPVVDNVSTDRVPFAPTVATGLSERLSVNYPGVKIGDDLWLDEARGHRLTGAGPIISTAARSTVERPGRATRRASGPP